METHLVVCAVGKDRAGIVDEFSKAVLDSGCTIGDSRMAVLGSEFAIVAVVYGNWNAVAKFENLLPRLEQSLDLQISGRRTESRDLSSQAIPYAIEVVALQSASVVHEVSSFFSRRSINIEDLYTSRYPAPHTGAPMYALHMTVAIPADTAIATVRGEFMDFCDDLNLDAMMAPVK